MYRCKYTGKLPQCVRLWRLCSLINCMTHNQSKSFWYSGTLIQSLSFYIDRFFRMDLLYQLFLFLLPFLYRKQKIYKVKRASVLSSGWGWQLTFDFVFVIKTLYFKINSSEMNLLRKYLEMVNLYSYNFFKKHLNIV